MGQKCIFPKCKSGYASQKSGEKIHFFKVPKDSVEAYQKAVRRENFLVKSGQPVCHKHYLPDDILWKREVKDADGNVMSMVRIKCQKYLKSPLISEKIDAKIVI